MKHCINLIYIILLSLVFSSCRKELDLIPKNSVDIVAFYKTPGDLETALFGCYNQVFRWDVWTKYMMVNDIASDDEQRYAAGGSFGAVDTRTDITKFNNFGEELWPASYQAIANLNLLLQNLPDVPETVFTRPARKAEIEGEAAFLRAFVYWHLLHHFGGVPIVKTFPTSASPDANKIPRNTKDEVYQQIMEDLQVAEAKAASNYNILAQVAIDSLKNTKGRATTWAAKMLMARWYLDKGDWQQALGKANEVINSGLYRLSNDPSRDNNYQRIFTGDQNTEESILESQNVQNENDQGAFVYFHLGAFPPFFGPTFNLADKGYDSTSGVDIRRAYSVGVAGDRPAGPVYAVKYRKFFGDADPDNYLIFRYAEALMIKAEAENELNGPGTEQLDIINTIRGRAKGVFSNVTYSGPAPVSMPATREEMRELIRSEKRREFALEGIRWYDLLRYGPETAMEAIRNSTGNSLDDANLLLLPIPLREEQVAGLVQNPGY